MKRSLIATALALVVVSGSALAQDNSGDRRGFYAGASLGSALNTNSRIVGGLDAGYQVNKYFRVETTFDQMWNVSNNGQAVMFNGVGQYRIPGTVITPYVLAGGGLGMGGMSMLSGAAAGLYNVGGGARIGLSDKAELDLRYRYIGHFDAPNANPDANVLGVGLNYRF